MHDDRSQQHHDDAPWTEAQWEESIALSAIRSAKFGELMETLINDPNRDDIIAEEMGWIDDADEDEDPEESARLIEAINAVTQDEESLREIEEEIAQRKAALAAREDYQRSFAFGLRVHSTLKPLMNDSEELQDDDVLTAFRDSLVIAAKLSGANAMGEDETVLCGNIVYCRKALAAAESCVAALEKLTGRHELDADTLNALLDEGREVTRLVEAHIDGLRSKVWWQ